VLFFYAKGPFEKLTSSKLVSSYSNNTRKFSADELREVISAQ